MKTDQLVSVVVIALILLHGLVVVLAFTGARGPRLAILLNLAVGLSILFYWVWKQLYIRQHFFDLAEILVLCFETTVVCISIYMLVSGNPVSRLKIIQYVVLGIHFLCTVLFLIFMLTFRMKRLI